MICQWRALIASYARLHTRDVEPDELQNFAQVRPDGCVL